MGRPSLAEGRTIEILEAFARCVARQGLEGTSLQDVAEEAGMKRSILRHYIGNRADLVAALAAHVGHRYRADLDAHVAALPAEGALDAALESLMPVHPGASAAEILVLESLIAAAPTDPAIREPMLEFVEHALATWRRLIRRERPGLTRRHVEAAAYGVISIWFNQSSLTPLRPPPSHRRAALTAARALLRSLPDAS